jgi:L-lactate utilization protein LutB
MEKRTLYSAANLLPELQVDAAKWSRIPAEQDIASSVKEIEARGIKVLQVEDGREALVKIQEIIPSGAEVMNGSSTTLIEIGYPDLLKRNEEEIRHC